MRCFHLFPFRFRLVNNLIEHHNYSEDTNPQPIGGNSEKQPSDEIVEYLSEQSEEEPEEMDKAASKKQEPQCQTSVTWEEFYSMNRTDIINPFEYRTLLSPSNGYCTDSTFAVVLIMSLHDHISRREAIRNTWGYWVKNMNISNMDDGKLVDHISKDNIQILRNIKPLFVFGKHRYDAMNNQSQIEAQLFNDVIQADFPESYKNLPRKNLLAYQFLTSRCKNIKYVFKVDDDHFANLPSIVNMLQNQPFRGKIMGRCLGPKSVKRKRSKNAIPCSVYALDEYPRYVNGNPGYILASDTLKDLFDESKYLPFLPVEDVFFTGIVATKRKIPLLCNQSFRPPKIKSGYFPKDMKFYHASDRGTVLNIWRHLVDHDTLATYS